MTYEMIVNKVRENFENADLVSVKGHMAIQCNITGEGHGIFYIEITDGRCNIQPYDYRDSDMTVTADADALLAYTTEAETFCGLMEAGRIQVYGNKANAEILNGFFKKTVEKVETVIPVEVVAEKEEAPVAKEETPVEKEETPVEKETSAPVSTVEETPAPAKATRKTTRKTTSKSTAKKDAPKKTTTRKTTSRKKTA